MNLRVLEITHDIAKTLNTLFAHEQQQVLLILADLVKPDPAMQFNAVQTQEEPQPKVALLTYHEAAEILGCPYQSVGWFVRSGKLTATKVDGKVRLSNKQVEAFAKTYKHRPQNRKAK